MSKALATIGIWGGMAYAIANADLDAWRFTLLLVIGGFVSLAIWWGDSPARVVRPRGQVEH